MLPAVKRIALFCCENSGLEAAEMLDPSELDGVDLIPLPCAGRIETILILKSLELDHAGVLVVGCPEDNCKFLSGNLRAAKRVEQARAILGSAGLDGEVVAIEYLSSVDAHKLAEAVRAMRERIGTVDAVTSEGARE